MAPKEVGGMGLGSIRSLNLALIAKWWWRLHSEPDSLWAKIIAGLHKKESWTNPIMAHRDTSGVWKNIVKSKSFLLNIGIEVEDVIRVNGAGVDHASKFVVDGKFSVSLLRNRIDRANHIVCDGPFHWNKLNPSKVVFFAWRARIGKIPSAQGLLNRGVNIASTECGCCFNNEETVDHLLITCPFAKKVWEQVTSWCGLPPIPGSSVRETIDYAARWGRCSKKKLEILTGVFYGTLWFIWRARNDRIFNLIACSPSKVFEFVKSNTFLWCKHRSGSANLHWNRWDFAPDM